jgi:hypothetical protein
MRYAIGALLIIAPAVTTLALAQDGGGHGPPKSVILTLPTLPTIPVAQTGGSLTSHFQPKAELGSMMK